jgi:hypothetical protein
LTHGSERAGPSGLQAAARHDENGSGNPRHPPRHAERPGPGPDIEPNGYRFTLDVSEDDRRDLRAFQ